MAKKIIFFTILSILNSCSTYYLYDTPAEIKQVEKNINPLNEAVNSALNSNILKRDQNGAIKKILQKNSFKGSNAKAIDLLQADYIDLSKRYSSYLKSNKIDAIKNFQLFVDMMLFIQNSDLIGLNYQNFAARGNRFLYDIVTKSNIHYIGFYRTISTIDEYRNFAIKNISGAKEYEALRVTFVKKIGDYKNKVFDYGLKQDEDRIFKLTGKKNFCQKSNPQDPDTIAAYLNLGKNINKDCIYCTCGLRVAKVLKNAVLATAYDPGSKAPSLSNVLVYTDQKYADYELLNNDRYAYFIKHFDYQSKMINVFRDFDINKYPFVKSTLKPAKPF